MKINKELVLDYLNKNVDYTGKDDEYKMVLLYAKHGLYSGLALARFKNTYRLVEFTIDFIDQRFSIKGTSGKELKKTVGNLNALFNHGKLFPVREDKNLVHFTLLLSMLSSMLSIYLEKPNWGRGVYRTVMYHPLAEMLANTLVDYQVRTGKHFIMKNVLPLLLALEYNQDKGHSLRKAFGLSKKQVPRFIDMISNEMLFFDNFYTNKVYERYDRVRKVKVNIVPSINTYYNYHHKINASNKDGVEDTKVRYCLSEFTNLMALWQKVDEARNAIGFEDLVYHYLQGVDKERGYHDSTDYFNENKDVIEKVSIFLSAVYCFGVPEHPLPDDWGDKDRTIADIVLTRGLVSKGYIDVASIIQLFVYAYASGYHQQALDFGDLLYTYKDYFHMVSKYPNYVKYPRYLKTAHDVAARNQDALKQDSYNIRQQYKKYKRLEGSFGKWSMVLFKTAKEIVTEGQQQSNCVGSYVDYVDAKKDLILGLRKTDDITSSNVTVELSFVDYNVTKDNPSGLTLVQTYAPYDTKLDPEQTSALLSYCKKMHIAVDDQHGTLSKDHTIKRISISPTLPKGAHEEEKEDVSKEKEEQVAAYEAQNAVKAS